LKWGMEYKGILVSTDNYMNLQVLSRDNQNPFQKQTNKQTNNQSINQFKQAFFLFVVHLLSFLFIDWCVVGRHRRVHWWCPSRQFRRSPHSMQQCPLFASCYFGRYGRWQITSLHLLKKNSRASRDWFFVFWCHRSKKTTILFSEHTNRFLRKSFNLNNMLDCLRQRSTEM
jgi:hypothetical protein